MDSIEFAWEVAQILRAQNDFHAGNTLDLCAGCGVIGFELNFHIPEIDAIDFNEVQTVYKAHFEHNKNLVLNPGRFQFLNFNYQELLTESFSKKYNLILCNPPYFRITQGKLSPSEFKNRCRFFIDSTFEKLIEVIQHILSDEGQAFLLLRPLGDHGFDIIDEAKQVLPGLLEIKVLGDIRGTHFVKLHRNTR